jgi:hypothetical protein
VKRWIVAIVAIAAIGLAVAAAGWIGSNRGSSEPTPYETVGGPELLIPQQPGT